MSCSLVARSDNSFLLENLTDERTELPVTDAVVTWDIRDAAYPNGTVLTSGGGIHVGDGTYLCSVPLDSVALTSGTQYFRHVVAVSPTAGTREFNDAFLAVDGTEPCEDTYSTDDDMELAFGRSNLLKWADVDNNRDWDAVKRRMTWARTQAKAELDARLRDSAYQFPLDITNRCLIPTLLTRMEAYLAAVLLYESRGVTDVGPDGKAQHALMWHRQRVEQFIKQIFARQVKLDGAVLRSDAVQQTSEAPDFISFRDPSHRHPRRVEDDMITMTPRRDW
jgi:phage gp36-like protein